MQLQQCNVMAALMVRIDNRVTCRTGMLRAVGNPPGPHYRVSNGPSGWQIVLSIRLGCLHCVLAAGGEGKAGAGAETSVEYSC